MANLLMSLPQTTASSVTCDRLTSRCSQNGSNFEIFVLSNSHLELIFGYLTYHELTRVRSVCRWFYFVVGAIMNGKFKSLSREVEGELSKEKSLRSPSESRIKVLTVLVSELRMLEAHCLSYINSSMFYFYGGLILDYVDFILATADNDDVLTDVSELFMLIDLFLQAYDGISEPVLLGRSYHLPFSWFGKKLLDVIDSYSCMEYFVSIEPLPDGSHAKWTGKYTATPIHSLLPPPILINTTTGEKKDLDSLLRFVRNHVRWNNILDLIKTSPQTPKRFEKRIHIEDAGSDDSSENWKQRIISEKSYLGETTTNEIRRLEINIGLFCHEIFAPSRYKELLELLANLRRTSSEDVTKSEDLTSSTEPEPPQKSDYELDLTIEITYKDDGLPRTTTLQVCHIDNACYIASCTTDFNG